MARRVAVGAPGVGVQPGAPPG